MSHIPDMHDKRAMIGLLRRIGQKGAGFQPIPTDEDLIRAAHSSGLVENVEGSPRITPAARAYMRRALVEGEEAFGDQHRDIRKIILGEGKARKVIRVNMAESPLAALARLKDREGVAWFSNDTIEAGGRLARDFHHAGLQPRITASWQPRLQQKAKGAAGRQEEFTDGVVAARMRVAKAAQSMGPELAGVVLDVCCFMKGLELVERERQWPARSAKLMLRTGLLALHRHYQLKRC